MKSKIQFDNATLKTALLTYKEDIKHLTDGEYLDDEELLKVRRFQAMDDVSQCIYYLYTIKGATEAAKLLGVSRQFVYKVVNKANIKINRKL